MLPWKVDGSSNIFAEIFWHISQILFQDKELFQNLFFFPETFPVDNGIPVLIALS